MFEDTAIFSERWEGVSRRLTAEEAINRYGCSRVADALQGLDPWLTVTEDE